MKWIFITLIVLLSGCKASSLYAPAGATGGAVVGSLGGPAMAGGGAILGYGLGKGAQLIDENKDLQETVQLLSTGDVETIAKNALEKGMQSQEGKFQEFVGKVEKWMIVAAVALVLYLFIPILVARKTATSCSKENREHFEKLNSETRPPFPVKPPKGK